MEEIVNTSIDMSLTQERPRHTEGTMSLVRGPLRILPEELHGQRSLAISAQTAASTTQTQIKWKEVDGVIFVLYLKVFCFTQVNCVL